jgi:hypothetical protein
MTKKVVSKVLDPIIRSTCTQTLVSEGFPAKSFRTILFFERKPWGNAPRQQEKYIKKRKQRYKEEGLTSGPTSG